MKYNLQATHVIGIILDSLKFRF